VRWPQLDACPLLASPCKSPRRCFRAIEADQQAPLQPASAAGDSLSDALRGLNLLRQAFGLAGAPNFTTLYRFLRRLDDVIIDQAIGETVRRLRAAVPGTTARICPPSSRRLPSKQGSDWCWPTLSSTARGTTPTSESSSARSVIPPTRGKKTWRIQGMRTDMRRSFPRQLHQRRSLIESLSGLVKRKLSARTRPVPLCRRRDVRPSCSDLASISTA
jgi:hypothetical protein